MSGDPALIGVVITSKEIYEAVVRLTGRVDVLIEQQNHTTADVADHETRIRTLERARWPLPTVATLLALASVVMGILPYIR